MKLNWKICRFAQLSNIELYQLLRLREEVFVVEQNCIYQDIDDLDQQSLHLLGTDDGQVLSYLRMMVRDQEIVMGRLVNAYQLGDGNNVVAAALTKP